MCVCNFKEKSIFSKVQHNYLLLTHFTITSIYVQSLREINLTLYKAPLLGILCTRHRLCTNSGWFGGHLGWSFTQPA